MLDQKKSRRVYYYMYNEQELLWVKAANMKAKRLKSRNTDLKYIIKMLQDELKKTKKQINLECGRPDFEYSEHISMCLDWSPRKSLRFINQIKNEIKT